jgi:hypothetical protein
VLRKDSAPVVVGVEHGQTDAGGDLLRSRHRLEARFRMAA